jgi:hypothetical protein
MQEERLRLRVGALPILNHFIERMGLERELSLALKNSGFSNGPGDVKSPGAADCRFSKCQRS